MECQHQLKLASSDMGSNLTLRTPPTTGAIYKRLNSSFSYQKAGYLQPLHVDMEWKMLSKWFMSSEVISHSCTSFQTFCAIWRKSVSLYERYAYTDASPHALKCIVVSKVVSTFNRGEMLTKVYHWMPWQNLINRETSKNSYSNTFSDLGCFSNDNQQSDYLLTLCG